MKIAIIGGTGTISSSVSRVLIDQGHDVWLINRGNRKNHVHGAHSLHLDVQDEGSLSALVAPRHFDAVADFIAFTPKEVERDFRIFEGKTGQYIFISSASVYEKPLQNYLVNESTPVANQYWEYSRNKIDCENILFDFWRRTGFPVTIIRPSHTYNDYSIPLGVHGRNGSWQVARRMLDGKPVIIHGDGFSLWTMTHSDDFARAFCPLIGNPQAIGEVFQITSSETLTWNQIYLSIAKALSVTLKPAYIASETLSLCSNYDFRGSLLGDKAHSVVFDNQNFYISPRF